MNTPGKESSVRVSKLPGVNTSISDSSAVKENDDKNILENVSLRKTSTPSKVKEAAKTPEFFYSVFNGNNGNIIRAVLDKRGNWGDAGVDENICKAHFVWKPTAFVPKVSIGL